MGNKRGPGRPKTGNWVANMVALARELGVSRRTICRYARVDGNPGATGDGRYNVEAWREFLAGASQGRLSDGVEDDPFKAAKLAIAQRQALRLDTTVRQQLGELVPVADAYRIIGRTFAAVKSVIENSKLSRSDKREIFNQLRLLPYDQYVAIVSSSRS